MAEAVLRWEHLRKTFTDGRTVRALEDVSGAVAPGEILGIVGESGCGKSTLARVLTRLTDADSGAVTLMGRDITRLRGRALRACYRDMQMVFQDAVGSFDPRRTVGSGIGEMLETFTDLTGRARQREVDRLLEQVGLQSRHGRQRPGDLSGGECQRAAIARAIAAGPRVLICDEATSALDVSMQAQVVELIERLSRELGMAVLLISHDLALVDSLCQRLMVLYEGRVVEEGPARAVIAHPREAYTRQLRSSVFSVEEGIAGEEP